MKKVQNIAKIDLEQIDLLDGGGGGGTQNFFTSTKDADKTADGCRSSNQCLREGTSQANAISACEKGREWQPLSAHDYKVQDGTAADQTMVPDRLTDQPPSPPLPPLPPHPRLMRC